ncbi:MAG TPA: MFS transporter, partial [Actinomycetales bacterium]|nr:MFS transporter [Actinomycetales bacterium]
MKTIETKVPARMDRLPWSGIHWKVIVGLGTVWILDGLEVTLIGSLAARLVEPGSGLPITEGQIGLAASIYILGACLGALFFGRLTDKWGRKKLFVLTLVVYCIATFATAFAVEPWMFFLCRFFTGAGIGGEYAAINSAVDELIPASYRGRVDILINGTYWLGAAFGSFYSLFFLNTAMFSENMGWRYALIVGGLLGVVIIWVRRHVPESPRWLFIHGREEESEEIVGEIEESVEEEKDEPLERVPDDDAITIHQRESITLTEIAKTAFGQYPKRAVLCLALFVGQAFLYNGITFNLGTLYSSYYGVDSGRAPLLMALFAGVNFLGALILGPLFDRVGRKKMISGTYLGSALATVPLYFVFMNQAGGLWGFVALLSLTFFIATAGASAAYLTVSEIFPMETRALAIAFFYAIGTGLGGIIGPLMFGQFIESGDRGLVGMGFLIAAGVMAVGGITEIFLGVDAEGQSLEDIAAPITSQDPAGGDDAGAGASDAAATPGGSSAPDGGG